MAFLSKDKVREIIQNAPEGTTPEGIVAALRAKGHTLQGFDELEAKIDVEKKKDLSGVEKVGSFLGTLELGTGLGRAAFGLTAESKQLEETRATGQDLQSRVLKRIREKRERGEDTSRLTGALGRFQSGEARAGIQEEQIRTAGLTGKQVIGSAIQTGLTIASAGAFRGALKTGQLGVKGARLGSAGGRAIGTTGGFKSRVAQGAVLGGAFGGAGAARGDESILKGVTTGAAFGGALPGIGAGVRAVGRQTFEKLPVRLFQSVLKQAPKQKLRGKDVASFGLQKRKVGTANKLINDSNRNISKLGDSIESIVKTSSVRGKNVNKGEIIREVVRLENEAGGAITAGEVSSILNALAPQAKGLLRKRSLNLEDALKLRRSIDKTLGDRGFLSTTLPARTEVLRSFTNALREDVKRKAPRTRALFAEQSKEITFRNALLNKTTRESGNQFLSFGDLFGVLPGVAIGGLLGAAVGFGVRRALVSTSVLTGIGVSLNEARRLAPILNKLDPATRAAVLESIAQGQRQ